MAAKYPGNLKPTGSSESFISIGTSSDNRINKSGIADAKIRPFWGKSNEIPCADVISLQTYVSPLQEFIAKQSAPLTAEAHASITTASMSHDCSLKVMSNEANLCPEIVNRIDYLTDQKEQATEIVQLLQKNDYQIECFTRDVLLKEHLEKSLPRLILIDPLYFDCIESLGDFLKPLRQNATQRTCIFVLAKQMDMSVRLAAMRAGADGLLAMPFSATEVYNRINDLLSLNNDVPYRVMIIEDDRSQALFTETILKQTSIQTCVVHDPMHVLNTLDTFKPELILMDLYMPECDGMELTTLIRQRENFMDIPIVFLSGEHDADTHFAALAAGGDDFLEKPIRPKHLVTAVTQRIKRARLQHNRVQTQSARDSVTGLYDRMYLMQSIQKKLSIVRTESIGGLFYINIDGAQATRDRIGLGLYDSLLHQTSAMLASIIEHVGQAARYSDASFIVDIQKSELMVCARSVYDRFSGHVFHVGANRIQLAVSIGIVAYTPQLCKFDDVLHAGEQACIRARQEPQERIKIYEKTKVMPVIDQNDVLLADIKDALRFDRFQLVFQPLASLHGCEDAQFQALLRLRGSTGKLYTASDIVPFAIGTELIQPIDQWVMQKAVYLLHDRQRQGRPIRLFVNQSIQAIQNPSYIQEMLHQLDMHVLPHNALVIEFCFDDWLSDSIAVTQIAERLCACGIGVSINRAPLAEVLTMISRISVNYVKINGDYRTKQHKEFQQELTQVMQRARETNTQIIAPQVEDAESAAFLWTTGVDFIQGNFVQRPTEVLDFDFTSYAL